jgi:hypothetical protein
MDILNPYRYYIAGIVLVSVMGGLAWYRHSLIEMGRDEVKAAVAVAVAKTEALANAQTVNLQEVKDEAIQQAEKRAAANAAAAGRARSELERLRSNSGSALGAAQTSGSACVDYAATSTAVLNECAGALVELASTADGHVNDLRATRESWPAWDKFTKEMTEFDKQVMAFTDNLKGNK